MSRSLAATCTAWQDFWACLSRALDTPGGENFHEAFVSYLADDLTVISRELGLDLDAELAAFRDEASRITDLVDLQRLYATLFLTPPAPVIINTGYYIDGGLKGPTESALEAFYHDHGLERETRTPGMADTPAAQCACLSLLYAGGAAAAAQDDDMQAIAYTVEAKLFLQQYPRRWITPALRELESARERRGVNGAYLHLFRMLWLAIENVATGQDDDTRPVVRSRDDLLPAGSSRGLGALSAEDLAEIAFCLERDGLSWDHVAKSEGWSDEVFARRRNRGDQPE